MKNTKKLLAMLSTLTLSACCLAPVAMNVSADDETGGETTVETPVNRDSIKITGISTEQVHTFEIYQVFTGDLVIETDENNKDVRKFKNLKWGRGVDEYNGQAVKEGDYVDSDILAFLEDEKTDAKAILANLTLGIFKWKYSSGGEVTFTGLADGYYVIKDVTDINNVTDDANSAWIVQVTGSEEITIKNAKPTVDKQVLDETGDAEAGSTDGWGESADHAINETFQFKLTATIPADEDLTAYDTYKLVFHDKMSDGVTFDGIKVGSDDVKEVTWWQVERNAGGEVVKRVKNYVSDGSYTVTAVDTNNEWTLTIDDLKSEVNGDGDDIFGKKEIEVEVIYNAHLNENAVVNKADVTDGTKDDTNNNTVYLEYSNNPYNSGAGENTPHDTGKTTEDTVWVFSYEVDNTKYKIEEKTGNELEGAKFSLHKGSADGDVVTMYKGTAIVDDKEVECYYPVQDSKNMPVANMESLSDGTFNIRGLDAGTYYLVEDEAPTGYNKIAPLQVVISATHSENADETTVNMTLSDNSDMNNKIVDTRTTKLPSTGGIGTTLFYLGGGCMVAVSGIFLISKKRMGRRDN